MVPRSRIRHRAERHDDIIVDGELHFFGTPFALDDERRRTLTFDALELDVGHNDARDEADPLLIEPFARGRPWSRTGYKWSA